MISKHVADHKVKEKWLAGGVRFIDSVPKASQLVVFQVCRSTYRSLVSIESEWKTTSTDPPRWIEGRGLEIHCANVCPYLVDA